MLLPNYEALKQMVDDDTGCITIFNLKDGKRDSVLFIIHNDGEMELSDDIREQVDHERMSDDS